ncbi:hypothetical protein CLAFUW4_06875 [Fulvia fulva]|uniref:Uncharacterized protein n=1 Tax=Passalora fulva TaxID=5499 RepID=A0A9Q8P9L6_PASFU|nr:uncharacterized protein CLAFUR5_07013 [Fulvia fulva]KAK4622158.1 hypothetical protein CLAFUR4_06883 [Fulvia fulva]KAK4622669.1 hypothetical protein CLAFUR0_06880 [Fulvia fulva]UJO18420.1 hypothetical protein CLAFUR5_07013 [Fulvia fulva]WPV16313.1 hypothetical protein CLAFUW4_06875 [Fulvia fulva]WPV31357.1 hypothetical protein CLAFUW7_06874 [Fulvia fulva]
MSQPQQCFLLTRLPRELRDRIYIEVLVAIDDINIENLEYDELWSHEEFPEPGLLRASRQLRYEALPVYYAHNIFRAIVFDEDSTPPLRWLSSIGHAGRKALRQLVIQYQISPGTRHQLEQDIEFSLQGSILSALRAILGHHMQRYGRAGCVKFAQNVGRFPDLRLESVRLDTGSPDPEPVFEHKKHHWRVDMERHLDRARTDRALDAALEKTLAEG